MVAFLQKLPELTPEAYRDLVKAGEGEHHHDEMGAAEGEAHEHHEHE